MKLLFNQSKEPNAGFFGGSKKGYSYKLVYSVLLEDAEAKVIADHGLDFYILFETKEHKITTADLLGPPTSFAPDGSRIGSRWVNAHREVEVKDIGELINAENRILEATRTLDSIIRFLGEFGAEYEYSNEEIRGIVPGDTPGVNSVQSGDVMKRLIAAGTIYGAVQRAEISDQLEDINANQAME